MLVPALLLPLLFFAVIGTDSDASEFPFFDGSSLKTHGCGASGKVCTRKCCQVNEILTLDGECARNDSFKFNVQVVERGFRSDTTSLNITFVPGMVSCPQDFGFYPLPSFKNFVSLGKDGKFVDNENEILYDYQEFCLETLGEHGTVAIVCTDEDKQGIFQPLSVDEGIYIVGETISLPFLLATFVVYAILPDRSLHAKALMCYVFALFMAFLLTVSARFAESSFDEISCISLVIFSVFFYVASFCWMNVMSFDIWWTFSGKSGFSSNHSRSETHRFLWYSVYGWIIPLLLCLVITTFSVSDIPYDAWYYPGIGEYLECWFKDEPRELLYFYGIMAVTIGINIVFFVITACKIRQVQRDTAVLSRQGSKKHGQEDDKYWFCLFLKLLLIMGLNWTMELIAWGVDWMINNVPPAVWYLSDLCNALYGVLIFFIFCFNKKTWKQLKKRYNRCRGIPESPHQSTQSTNTVRGGDARLLNARQGGTT